MRKIQNIAFVLLATLFAGCINDHIENALCRDGVLSLNLSTGATTRTDTPNNGVGEGQNDNRIPTESAIKDIQFFLYPNGSTESVNATFAGRIDVTATDKTEQTVTVPADVINKLCPNPGDECDIYVIVNYIHQGGEDLTDNTDTSRATLKSLPLETVFYDLGIPPASFVMDSEVFGVTRGTGDNSNKLTSETIYVTRAAAKVMIEVTVQSTVDVSGVQWQPVTEVESANEYFARISFYNGVKEGVIDDNSDTEPTGKDIAGSASADPYYHAENIELIPGGISSDITNPGTSSLTRASSKAFITDAPLYSYTSSWSDGDEDAPYFKLSIPWRKVVEGQDDNAAWVTYDYTVPISLKTNQLVRNKLYLIRLNVGALGDLDYLDPAVYSYVVLDWEDVSMNAELTRPKYFVVEEEYVEIYNEPSYIVDFSATDIVTAEILSVIKPDYSQETAVEDNYIFGSANNTNGDTTFSPSSGNTSPFTVSVDNSTDDGDGKSITLTHTLNNDMDSNGFDYVPYTVVVRATMTITDSAGNTTTMVKDITFKQYPAMYIKADRNTGGNIVSDSQADDDKGFVFVYNNQLYSGEQWQVVRGCYDGGNTSNKNPNMYVITTSVVEEPYILADPRSRTAQTGSDLNLTTSFNGKSLTYYYGSSTDNKYYLAPKFRIASSYGKCGSTISLTDAKRRCAAYQEQGYPAGRWRIPTYAELDYIAKISGEGFIPHLFSNNGNYWCATSRITYHTDGSIDEAEGANNSYVRCVYDEWYWGSEPIADKTKFTWGDEKIW